MWLNTADCFFLKIFKCRRSSLLTSLHMSGLSLKRKNPILTQELSTILQEIFGGWVRLFVNESWIKKKKKEKTLHININKTHSKKKNKTI